MKPSSHGSVRCSHKSSRKIGAQPQENPNKKLKSSEVLRVCTKEDLLGARDDVDKLLREKACGRYREN